jgi:hypothetical protein
VSLPFVLSPAVSLSWCSLNASFGFSVWFVPNLSPKFLARIGVNESRAGFPIQMVAARLFGAGNPELLAGVDVEIVGFEAVSLQALENVTPVVKRSACFRKPNASDARVPD